MLQRQAEGRTQKAEEIPDILTPITTANETVNPFKQCPKHENLRDNSKEGDRPAFLIIAQHLKTFFSWGERGRQTGLRNGEASLICHGLLTTYFHMARI